MCSSDTGSTADTDVHGRSFAIVIQQLDVELRDAVCVFYLVLRALDTVCLWTHTSSTTQTACRHQSLAGSRHLTSMAGSEREQPTPNCSYSSLSVQVEDDMALSEETKLPLLEAFHTFQHDREWTYSCGEGAYKDLMQQYTFVTQVNASSYSFPQSL
mgnify:CR=1 FL=1